jgi:hypothetical protein
MSDDWQKLADPRVGAAPWISVMEETTAANWKQARPGSD